MFCLSALNRALACVCACVRVLMFESLQGQVNGHCINAMSLGRRLLPRSAEQMHVVRAQRVVGRVRSDGRAHDAGEHHQ
jgi:hypothetical protein